jgi:hypothetical protein
MVSYLDIARRVMRERQEPEPDQAVSLEEVFKGVVVELYLVDGDRLFIVADEEDAVTLNQPRGQVYTAAEARRIIAVNDPAVVAEIHEWKREFNARLSDHQPGRGHWND